MLCVCENADHGAKAQGRQQGVHPGGQDLGEHDASGALRSSSAQETEKRKGGGVVRVGATMMAKMCNFNM